LCNAAPHIASHRAAHISVARFAVDQMPTVLQQSWRRRRKSARSAMLSVHHCSFTADQISFFFMIFASSSCCRTTQIRRKRKNEERLSRFVSLVPAVPHNGTDESDVFFQCSDANLLGVFALVLCLCVFAGSWRARSHEEQRRDARRPSENADRGNATRPFAAQLSRVLS
jgi:hypothetical protein